MSRANPCLKCLKRKNLRVPSPAVSAGFGGGSIPTPSPLVFRRGRWFLFVPVFAHAVAVGCSRFAVAARVFGSVVSVAPVVMPEVPCLAAGNGQVAAGAEWRGPVVDGRLPSGAEPLVWGTIPPLGGGAPLPLVGPAVFGAVAFACGYELWAVGV